MDNFSDVAAQGFHSVFGDQMSQKIDFLFEPLVLFEVDLQVAFNQTIENVFNVK